MLYSEVLYNTDYRCILALCRQIYSQCLHSADEQGCEVKLVLEGAHLSLQSRSKFHTGRMHYAHGVPSSLAATEGAHHSHCNSWILFESTEMFDPVLYRFNKSNFLPLWPSADAQAALLCKRPSLFILENTRQLILAGRRSCWKRHLHCRRYKAWRDYRDV